MKKKTRPLNHSTQCEGEANNNEQAIHEHPPTKSLSLDEILKDQLAQLVLDEKDAIAVIDDAIIRALPWNGDQII